MPYELSTSVAIAIVIASTQPRFNTAYFCICRFRNEFIHLSAKVNLNPSQHLQRSSEHPRVVYITDMGQEPRLISSLTPPTLRGATHFRFATAATCTQFRKTYTHTHICKQCKGTTRSCVQPLYPKLYSYVHASANICMTYHNLCAHAGTHIGLYRKGSTASVEAAKDDLRASRGQELHFYMIFDAAMQAGWHRPPTTRCDHMGAGRLRSGPRTLGQAYEPACSSPAYTHTWQALSIERRLGSARQAGSRVASLSACQASGWSRARTRRSSRQG